MPARQLLLHRSGFLAQFLLLLQLKQFHASDSNDATTTNSHGGLNHDHADNENTVEDDDDDDGAQRFAALRSATVGSGIEGGGSGLASPAAAQAHQHRPDLFQASSAKNVLEFRRLSIAVRELPGKHLCLILHLVARQKAVRFVSSCIPSFDQYRRCALLRVNHFLACFIWKFRRLNFQAKPSCLPGVFRRRVSGAAEAAVTRAVPALAEAAVGLVPRQLLAGTRRTDHNRLRPHPVRCPRKDRGGK